MTFTDNFGNTDLARRLTNYIEHSKPYQHICRIETDIDKIRNKLATKIARSITTHVVLQDTLVDAILKWPEKFTSTKLNAEDQKQLQLLNSKRLRLAKIKHSLMRRCLDDEKLVRLVKETEEKLLIRAQRLIDRALTRVPSIEAIETYLDNSDRDLLHQIITGRNLSFTGRELINEFDKLYGHPPWLGLNETVEDYLEKLAKDGLLAKCGSRYTKVDQ